MLVNYKGRPWMKGVTENHALFLSVVACVAGCSIDLWSALTAAARRADNYFVYKPRPDDGRPLPEARGPARARSTTPGRTLE